MNPSPLEASSAQFAHSRNLRLVLAGKGFASLGERSLFIILYMRLCTHADSLRVRGCELREGGGYKVRE